MAVNARDGEAGAIAVNGALLGAGAFDTWISEVVFIDGAVADGDMLAAGVNPGVLAVRLDPSRDGVTQIADWLSAHEVRNLAAIGIVSHGADGVLFLGSSVLDTGTIGSYREQLSLISTALRPGGALLLYGCDVAQDSKGVAFVDQLSAAMGDVPIAASSHVVGSQDLGGSFTLDVNIGNVGAPTPFTAAAQASFAGVLPTTVNQLYFTVGNTAPTATVNRVNQIGVSGTTTVGSVVTLIDGSQATFGNGTTVITLPGVAVDPAAGKFFFTDTNSNATFNKIYSGNISSPGGSVTAIVSTPTTTTQLQGLALDQPNGNLYFALNASTAGSIGIYSVSEAGGTPTQIVGGFTSAAHALFQVALDIPDNLVFFADSPALSSVSTLWAGNILSHTSTALATSAKGARLEGVAYNNGTIYWSTINGGTIANNNIFSAPVTISGSGSLTTASLGTTSTLYAGAATGNGTTANTPISLAVDSTTGVLYSGTNFVSGGTYFAAVNAGTVTGGSSMTTIFSSAFGGTASVPAPILGLVLETTPTVTASGSVNYLLGGPAVTIAPSASVSNPSGYNLANAMVAITGGSFVGDGTTLTAITSGTSINASFSGQTLTLSGNDTLDHYKQVLDSVAYKSTASDPTNGGANLTRTVSWTVSDGIITSSTPTSTIVIDRAPTIVAGGSISFTGGGSAVVVDSGVTPSDPDGGNLAGATISLSSFVNGDLLNFTNQSGITGSYASGTGVLTLAGTTTIGNYQTALRSITYSFNPSNGDPTGGGTKTSRTVSWVVNDGVASNTAATSSLTVIHASPTVVAAGTIAYGAGSGPVVLDASATVVAPNSLGLIASATISVSGGLFAGAGDVLSATVAGTSISASYNSATEVLTLTGSDTVAHYQQVLRTVSIDASGADPTNGGSNPSRTLSWIVNDGVADSTASTTTANAAICFCAGSLILTPTGEVPVERLQPGDMVLNKFGHERRIVWIGSGRVLATRGRRGASTPIIVRKAALADNVPHRDLHVTKGHCFFLDGVLIPVEFLVNNRSILWDDHAQEVSIYHVELETHDLLVANGAPAESYRDDGNRWLFQNKNSRWDDQPMPPFAEVLTGGPIVDAVWRKLLDRAGTRLAIPLTADPDLHLWVDGQAVEPASRRGSAYVFRFRARRRRVRILSRDGVPLELGVARDSRSLGVAIRRIVLRQGTLVRTIDAGDERLDQGFHPYESDRDLRWTMGDATLPAALFAGFREEIELVIVLGGATEYPADIEIRRSA